MAIAHERLSLQEFLGLPEEEPALEFQDGVVTRKVSPQGKHSRLQAALVGHINQFAAPSKLALAFPELRTTFGNASRVPDVAVYRWNRIPRDPDGSVSNAFNEPPDIAIEIISPGQGVTALVRRCLDFIGQGVAVVLLIDVDDRTVMRFERDGRVQALRGSDEVDLSLVAPELRLTAQKIFDFLRLD
jgi:Uma2 family endonuclease